MRLSSSSRVSSTGGPSAINEPPSRNSVSLASKKLPLLPKKQSVSANADQNVVTLLLKGDAVHSLVTFKSVKADHVTDENNFDAS